MNETAKIEKGTVNAKFAWMLHEHHAWTRLADGYFSSRTEFNARCSKIAMDAACNSENQPNQDDFKSLAEYDAAMLEHGTERLTCDRGGHAGPSERVDVSDIDLTLLVDGSKVRIHLDDLDEQINAEAIAENYELPPTTVAAIVNAAEEMLNVLRD